MGSSDLVMLTEAMSSEGERSEERLVKFHSAMRSWRLALIYVEV